MFVVTNALRLRRFRPSQGGFSEGAEEQKAVIDENTPTIVIGVEGMMCGHCTAAVEKACKDVPGVVGAFADLEKKQVTVRGDADVTALRNAINEAGYPTKM